MPPTRLAAIPLFMLLLGLGIPTVLSDELPNARIRILDRNLTVSSRIADINLTFQLVDEDARMLTGAAGNVSVLGRLYTLREEDGSYSVHIDDISAGTQEIRVSMSKTGYSVPDLVSVIYVEFETTIEGETRRLDLSRLSFSTDRPEICHASLQDSGVNVSIGYDGSRIPTVQFSLDFEGPCDLSGFDYAMINISYNNCPSLRMGFEDQEKGKMLLTLDPEGEDALLWEYQEGAEWMDLASVSRIVFHTFQRADGTNHSVKLESVVFVRDPVYIHICPPTLRNALNVTLSHRADPLFVDEETGLPYEFINLYEFTLPDSSDLDFTIGNNEIGEGLTSFWMYYLGSEERWVGDFLRRAVVGEARYLDPGDGLIGLHHYDRRTGELEEDTHRLTGCKFRGGPAGESSAQHGGEDPMYMMLPGAWCFSEEEAIAALERYSRTLLRLNSDPELVHLHLYVKRCDRVWSVGDWNGLQDEEMEVVAPDPRAFSDLSEFWWITPMLGTAVFTENETLKDMIVDRCRIVMDNVIEHQAPDGEIPFVYTMDGEESEFGYTAKGWAGYNVNSFYARSAYMMHNLTGEQRYIDSLNRMYDHLLRYGIPGNYRFASQIVFHSFYTGNASFADRLVDHIRSEYTMDRIEDDILGCTWRLLAWIWDGNEEDLRIALEGESRFRANNWLEIPEESGRYHYYPPYVVDTIIEWGWCPLDKFGSGVEDFYALLQLGPSSRGLVERDLLTLGFLAQIPSMAGTSALLLVALSLLLFRDRDRR